jgi:AraC-like DNA-binding protein
MENKVYRNDAHFSAMLGHHRRILSNALPIGVVGYLPEKTHSIDWHLPDTEATFAFVTEGRGFFELDGIRKQVVAPFAFLEISGHHYRYGPAKSWRQYYLTYSLPENKVLKRWRIDPKGPLFWPLASPSALINHLDAILAAVDSMEIDGCADRIDTLGELAILECLLDSKAGNLDDDDKRILEAERFIRANYRTALRLDEVSRKFGFSRAGFHRRWKKHFRSAPVATILNLRLNSALRSLLHTDATIKEIAIAEGFADQRYFARIFKKTFGASPTSVRERSGDPAR